MRNKWWLQDKAGDDKVGAGGGAAAGGEGAAAGAAGAGAGVAGAGGAAGATGSAGASGAAAAGGGEAKGFTWGDGWREQLAGNDDKARQRLERFQSPADIFKSYRALEQRVSSGELKANLPFPDKGTDEEKAAWRKDAGLPDKPEAYDLKFDDGFVLGEDSKPMVENFLKRAHERNMPNSAVKDAVRWYFEDLDKRAEEQQQADQQVKQATEDTLRVEWGVEYRKNVNLVKSLMDTAPAEVRDRVMSARLSDGTPLLSDPHALRWLNSLARTVNPAATVVPGADSASMASSVDDEIKVIEKFMRTNRAEYNKDSQKQERLRELYGARAQLSKKA